MSGPIEGRVVEVVAELGKWRWECGNPNGRWHYRINDRGWASSRDEARALLEEHWRTEHTQAREARWEVEFDDVEWWTWTRNRSTLRGPFPTWREAFDYADRMARAER